MNRPLSLDALREAARAEMKLAQMQHSDDLVRWCATAPDLLTRDYCRRRYKELIGVSIERRAELRAALEAISRGSGQTVAEIVHVLA